MATNDNGHLDTKSGSPAAKPGQPTAGRPDPQGFTSVATLRENARRNIDDGAITESYSADRAVVIAKLNECLATEWVCVLRYMRHYFCLLYTSPSPRD